MKDIVLEMSNITKVYNGVKALDHVSIKIKRGEVYGLVGNNGAGKTTLMRLIAGQTELQEGTIKLFGETNEVMIRTSRRRMGVLIEEPGFYKNMTAAENLEYFRIQFGIPGKEVVSEVLKEVGLENTGKKKYKQFSLGMKQRLGIALALLHTPELLILDEPINGLDPAGIIEVRQTLLEINKRRNTTILIASHILAEMANIATTYGFLSNGKLLEEITAAELAEKCSVYLDIIVDDPKSMCILLEKEMHYKNFKVYPNQHIHLYEGLEESNRICELAVSNKIGVVGIVRQVVNLENYYMSIVEGC
ncbi:ABC transporter ATP-binding protein [Anaeromicropila populeti]|uniref:ABC-2 type transport system ATP-binding protein n=1 Tax=Anaeromicropila populeti TaxID=37658 RepID=A0A1I6K970_9FIRM|nr:ATP-binding cassette domain-containing protein [Anaeromicropila populeti]SFR87769.1 ABC-2 type transport system ATP-binding protein [Anaeromicropila populeti]